MWVFGYGSLLWDPGFPFSARLPARLDGWRRSFCMHSVHYRGTPEQPGLVLALDADAGARCEGVAFAVAPEDAEPTLGYLRARELISDAYLERWLPVTLDDGRRVEALCYVIDPAHAQYCGGLSLEQQAAIIAGATGVRGPNRDYLHNTVDHLRALGIPCGDLDRLDAEVRALDRAKGL